MCSLQSLRDLPKDKKVLHIDDSIGISQEILEYIADNFLELESLSIAVGYDDTELLFSHLSFPKLKRLSMDCVGLDSFHFEKKNYPCLMSLNVENISSCAKYFRLDLPQLKRFTSRLVQLRDGSEFERSIASCTNLEVFECYKFYGLPETTCSKLYLPNCRIFCLNRSDDLVNIELYAPKMAELDLQGCFNLEHLRIVENPFGHRAKCLTCEREEPEKNDQQPSEGAELKRCGRCRVARYCSRACQSQDWINHKAICGKRIVVNLANTSIDDKSLNLLNRHPRVKQIKTGSDPSNPVEAIWKQMYSNLNTN